MMQYEFNNWEYQDIFEEIAVYRKMNGITQKELAIKSGMDQADISRLEQGMRNPSLSVLNRLAEALGCELHLVPKSEQTMSCCKKIAL